MKSFALLLCMLLAVSAVHGERRTLLQDTMTVPAPGPGSVAPSMAPALVPAPESVSTPTPVPTMAAPVPAPSMAPVPAPVPAPMTAVPAPAPMPAFAPVPVPAPAYVPPPLCGVMPQCKLYVEDMLCCKDMGLQNNKPATAAWLLCSQFVSLPASCLSVSGPANVSVYDVFTDDAMYTRRHRYIINYSNTTNYTGPVVISVEANRTRSPECALNISPCLYNNGTANVTINSTAPVPDLKFVSQAPMPFADGLMGCNNYDLGLLDSWAWINKNGTCLQELTGALPKPFFTDSNWVNYDNIGFNKACNVTAALESVNGTHIINATVIAQNISAANSMPVATSSAN